MVRPLLRGLWRGLRRKVLSTDTPFPSFYTGLSPASKDSRLGVCQGDCDTDKDCNEVIGSLAASPCLLGGRLVHVCLCSLSVYMAPNYLKLRGVRVPKICACGVVVCGMQTHTITDVRTHNAIRMWLPSACLRAGRACDAVTATWLMVRSTQESAVYRHPLPLLLHWSVAREQGFEAGVLCLVKDYSYTFLCFFTGAHQRRV